VRTDDLRLQDARSHADLAHKESARPSDPLEANSNLIMITFLIGSAALLALVSVWVLARFSPQSLRLGLGSPQTTTAAPSPTPTAPPTQTPTPTPSPSPSPLPIVVPSSIPPDLWTGSESARRPSPGRTTARATGIVALPLATTHPTSAATASPVVTPAAAAVPGAPTNVTASAGDAAAAVSWTAPADGGSAITSYTITPYIETTAQTPSVITGGPPATSATVTGLTNGTTYTFTITSTNAIGTGPASAVSNAMTPTSPTVPGAPTDVTATTGNGSATITWTAPSDGGSIMTSYDITPFIETTAQTPTVITGGAPATSATVTGLTNGTTYTFTVTAANAIGTGPPSAQSNPVTPSL
jgi:hypothetical protein